MERKEKMKKKVLSLVLAVTVALVMIPGLASASTAKAAAVTATVQFTATSLTGFDMMDKTVTADSDMAETYYPAIAANETAGKVSVADVLVAAHIAKYGAAFKADPTKYLDMYNSSYGTSMSKQFGHSNIGLWYVNNKGIAKSVSVDTVKSGDQVAACSYEDGTTNWSDLYSYFDKASYAATAGTAVSMTIKADNFGTEVIPSTVSLKSADVKTGKLTALKADSTANGKAVVTFTTPGTYYVSASGTVKYSGWGGDKTGGIFAPLAKVTVAPAAPAGVKAKSAGWKSVKVSWTKVTGTASYKVYRSVKKDSGFKLVKTVKANSFTNTKLKTGKKYYYKIKAVKGTLASAYSQRVSAKAAAKAPTLKLTAGKNTIKATWSSVNGASGYKLYRAASKNGKFKAVRTAKGSWHKEYTSINKKSGKKYFYKVKAYKTVNGKNVYTQASAVKAMAAK